MKKIVEGIHLGDAFELIKQVPDGSVDLVLTSPPYGIGKEYEKRAKSADDYIEKMRPIAAESVRVLKPTGSIAWQVGFREDAGEQIPLSYLWLPVFRELGMRLRNEIVWCFDNNKPFGGDSGWHRLMPRHETVLWMSANVGYYFDADPIRVPQKYPNKKIFSDSQGKYRGCNPKGKVPGDWWQIQEIHGNMTEKWDHPAQMPEELARRIILMACPRGGARPRPFLRGRDDREGRQRPREEIPSLRERAALLQPGRS